MSKHVLTYLATQSFFPGTEEWQSAGMMTRKPEWAAVGEFFTLSVIISNHCDLPNEMFKRVHWEGKKQNQNKQKKPHWAIFKKLHLPSLDKMWKGPGINMGIELFVLFELYWRKWNLTPLSIYQAICQYRNSRVKLLVLLTKLSVY